MSTWERILTEQDLLEIQRTSARQGQYTGPELYWCGLGDGTRNSASESISSTFNPFQYSTHNCPQNLMHEKLALTEPRFGTRYRDAQTAGILISTDTHITGWTASLQYNVNFTSNAMDVGDHQYHGISTYVLVSDELNMETRYESNYNVQFTLKASKNHTFSNHLGAEYPVLEVYGNEQMFDHPFIPIQTQLVDPVVVSLNNAMNGYKFVFFGVSARKFRSYDQIAPDDGSDPFGYVAAGMPATAALDEAINGLYSTHHLNPSTHGIGGVYGELQVVDQEGD